MLSLVLNPLLPSSFSPNPTAPALLSGLTSPLLSCSLLPLVHTSSLSGKKKKTNLLHTTQFCFCFCFCNLAATYLIYRGFFCCCCLIFCHLLSVSVLLTCMSIHHVCSGPLGARRAYQAPRAGVTEDCKTLCGAGEWTRVPWKSNECF